MGTEQVLIVGGGIGGLTLANALSQRGIDVEIAEKAPEFLPIGAGIGLALNAMSVFRELGLKEELDRVSRHLPEASVCDHSTRDLRTMSFTRMLACEEAVFTAIRRSDLQAVLTKPLPPALFKMGTEVTELTQNEDRVEVTFSDGKTSEYDVVIGADGVHSSIRTMLFRRPTVARRVGVAVWQFILKDFPHGDRFRESIGRGRRVGIIPLTAGDAYVFMTRNAALAPIDWGSDPKSIQADFSEFTGLCAEAISRINEVEGLVSREFLEVHLPTWNRGRIVLLGDAAHAMTPNMGQGAAMAIEDAYVLANCLAKAERAEQAIRQYQTIRRKRVDWMQKQSGAIGWIMQSESLFFRFVRDFFVRRIPDAIHARGFRRAHLGGPVEQMTCPQTA
ncbi:MAG: NAD(P)-binding protein [Pirellulaceae bacterium]|nr:NAD(P)-binding protein [Pirellulaceae bacterium]